MGIVEGSCGFRTRGISILGKFVLPRKPGHNTRGRHVAKRSSDPRVAYPEVKVQVRDLLRVVGIVACLAPRVSVLGENSFYRGTGVNGHRRPVRVPSAAVRHGRDMQSSGTEPRWDCRKFLWLSGPRG